MNYLDRNTLPKFQERLDLAASELNDMEDIFVAALNELAGRIYILSAMVPAGQRSQYAEETNYLILDKLTQMTNQITTLNQEIAEIRATQVAQTTLFDERLTDLETRLNYLDDAAARKEDLNVILWRTGHEDEIETI